MKELINYQGAALLCMGRNFLQTGRSKQLVLGANHCKSSLAENNLGVLLENTGNMSQECVLAARKADKIWAAEGSGES